LPSKRKGQSVKKKKIYFLFQLCPFMRHLTFQILKPCFVRRVGKLESGVFREKSWDELDASVVNSHTKVEFGVR